MFLSLAFPAFAMLPLPLIALFMSPPAIGNMEPATKIGDLDSLWLLVGGDVPFSGGWKIITGNCGNNLMNSDNNHHRGPAGI